MQWWVEEEEEEEEVAIFFNRRKWILESPRRGVGGWFGVLDTIDFWGVLCKKLIASVRGVLPHAHIHLGYVWFAVIVSVME